MNLRQPTQSRLTTNFVGVLAVLFLGACASSPSASSPSPTPNAGAEYTTMAGPSNAAITQFNLAQAASPMDSAKVRATAQVLLDTDVAFNADLLRLEKDVPAQTRAHIESGRALISLETVDLQSVIGSKDDAGLNTALDTLNRDGQLMGGTFALIRSDLGLPPPPQT